jgi:hypothetical protein
MNRQQFIDYIWDYGTHVVFIYGDSKLKKRFHTMPHNSSFSNFELTNSKVEIGTMGFTINGEYATIDQCVELVKPYSRSDKLNILGV